MTASHGGGGSAPPGESAATTETSHRQASGHGQGSPPRRYLRRSLSVDHTAEREERARARARLLLTEAHHEAAPPPDPTDVRRVARLHRRWPSLHPEPDRWTAAGLDGWTTAVRHLRTLGYDVRSVVPDSARRAWQRQRCGCDR